MTIIGVILILLGIITAYKIDKASSGGIRKSFSVFPLQESIKRVSNIGGLNLVKIYIPVIMGVCLVVIDPLNQMF